jgi:hypothetical protein
MLSIWGAIGSKRRIFCVSSSMENSATTQKLEEKKALITQQNGPIISHETATQNAGD